MKKMKRILGMALAFALLYMASMPVFAIGAPTSTIIVTPAPEGATYEAYYIMDAIQSEDGKSVNYSVYSDYEGILREMVPTGDIVEHIRGLSGKDLQDFADTLYTKIKAAGIEPDWTASSENGQAVFDYVGCGYILIGQSKAADNEPFSALMADTTFLDEITYVTPKTDTPVMQKKVLEKNDSTGGEGVWQDAADYDIGDKVPFKITATLPNNLSRYNTYSVKFHDTLGSGLSYDNDLAVYVINASGEKQDVTSLFQVQNEGSTLTFSCDDLLKNESALNGQSLSLEYTATLSTSATLGTAGNPNTVYMEYSRNPYGTETGKTAADKVNVFTYQIKINKVDGDNQPLTGATFTLYKYDAQRSDYQRVDGQYPGPEFLFKGLDAGQYKLVEDSPSGYKSIDPIEFKVESTYDTEAADPALTDLTAKKLTGESITGEGKTFSVDLAKGQLLSKVVNKAGSELPSTGGKGTLLIYICGSILVVSGILFLFLKKRKKTLD